MCATSRHQLGRVHVAGEVLPDVLGDCPARRIGAVRHNSSYVTTPVARGRPDGSGPGPAPRRHVGLHPRRGQGPREADRTDRHGEPSEGTGRRGHLYRAGSGRPSGVDRGAAREGRPRQLLGDLVPALPRRDPRPDRAAGEIQGHAADRRRRPGFRQHRGDPGVRREARDELSDGAEHARDRAAVPWRVRAADHVRARSRGQARADSTSGCSTRRAPSSKRSPSPAPLPTSSSRTPKTKTRRARRTRRRA